jgi:hypothetical protein
MHSACCSPIPERRASPSLLPPKAASLACDEVAAATCRRPCPRLLGRAFPPFSCWHPLPRRYRQADDGRSGRLKVFRQPGALLDPMDAEVARKPPRRRQAGCFRESVERLPTRPKCTRVRASSEYQGSGIADWSLATADPAFFLTDEVVIRSLLS